MEASIISGLFALLIGAVGLWTGFRQLRNRRELNRWPSTSGKVVERGTYQPDNLAVGPPAFRHSPLVRYVYQVGGREFVNNCIRPKRIQLPQHNTKQWAQKTAESFPAEVTVHYNPADPSDAYLVQTPKALLYVVILASAVAILFGLALFLIK
jgi:Protein of unknown function (DUF3592)